MNDVLYFPLCVGPIDLRHLVAESDVYEEPVQGKAHIVRQNEDSRTQGGFMTEEQESQIGAGYVEFDEVEPIQGGVYIDGFGPGEIDYEWWNEADDYNLTLHFHPEEETLFETPDVDLLFRISKVDGELRVQVNDGPAKKLTQEGLKVMESRFNDFYRAAWDALYEVEDA